MTLVAEGYPRWGLASATWDRDGSTLSSMSVRKISMSIPGWLEPIIRDAASRDGLSVSAWLTEAAKTALIEREAAERRRREAEHGIDRQAQLARAETALREDRARAAGVKGAA